ncbi:MAG: ribonuclease activity regulator RraA, partial [Sulfitobacter sp.]
IVVGDDDCVIIIPADIDEEVADEAVEMTAYEDFVVEQVKGGAGIIGLYPGTKQENLDRFAEWRKANNR